MLNTQYDVGERPAAPEPLPLRAKWHDDTCLYIRCPDVDAAYAHLKERWPNVAPPSVAPYGMKQLYARDPDGYSICFQWSAKE
jgi:hypothetical protein